MGHFRAPLEFTPVEHWAGAGRYDSPLRAFRTLYCAPDPLTCLREKLAVLRLPLRLREQRRRKGQSLLRLVTSDWRGINALASGFLEILEGELIPIFEPGVRARLEDDLKDLLLDLRIAHLDLGEVQTGRRRLTQAVAQRVFEWGEAGLLYQSRYDGQLCCALFEGRARLRPAGASKHLTESLPELEQVCREFRLDLEEVAVPQPSS